MIDKEFAEELKLFEEKYRSGTQAKLAVSLLNVGNVRLCPVKILDKIIEWQLITNGYEILYTQAYYSNKKPTPGNPIVNYAETNGSVYCVIRFHPDDVTSKDI
jgi:hypothetical protein